MSRFSSDGPMLDKVVDGIHASDTPADLPRALGAAADALRDRKNPLIVLISDGAFPEQQLGLVEWDGSSRPTARARRPPTKNLAAVDLSNIDVRYLPVGHRSDNVGIVAFNVRRYIANKAAYEVFIEIQNFGRSRRTAQLHALQRRRPPVDTADDRPRARPAHPPDLREAARRARTTSCAPSLAPGRRRRRQRRVRARRHGVRAPARAQEAEGPDGHRGQPVPRGRAARLRQRRSAQGHAGRVRREAVDRRRHGRRRSSTTTRPTSLPPPPASLLFFHPTGANSAVHGRAASSRTRASPRSTRVTR